ncbi:MAG: hypothetical protein Q9Q13_06105 [Acidobacteriota bacterium]|nr:hypothetical protein [Acidobacteriota bacterium]
MAGFSVVSNLGALNAMNKLSKTQIGMSRTLERLSSGLRINGAKDDAAGLAIADALRADVAALNQGVRNANDGIGVINVTDSALGEISNLLQRAVTLASQAASETSGADNSTSKGALNDEYTAILNEIDRIASTVEFNGVNLLSSGGATVDVQIGMGNTANDSLRITTTAVTAAGLGLDTGRHRAEPGLLCPGRAGGPAERHRHHRFESR